MVDRGTFSDMNNDLSFVDATVRTFATVQTSRVLPQGFAPNNWTVICGRGKTSYNHVGNRRFRILCECNEERYEKATTKTEKSMIVMNIVEAIRAGSCCGGFVKQDPFTKEWFEVSDAVAREKVGQQLRENLAKRSAARKSAEAKALKAKRRRSNDSSDSSVGSSHSNGGGDARKPAFARADSGNSESTEIAANTTAPTTTSSSSYSGQQHALCAYDTKVEARDNFNESPVAVTSFFAWEQRTASDTFRSSMQALQISL